MSRRFEAEVASVESAVSRAPRARLLEVDRAGRRIAVELRVRTLVRRGGGTVSVEERAVATTFLLHVEHPRIPPLAILRDAEVWNPHVADPRATRSASRPCASATSPRSGASASGWWRPTTCSASPASRSTSR
jgi:hypothetical protein